MNIINSVCKNKSMITISTTHVLSWFHIDFNVKAMWTKKFLYGKTDGKTIFTVFSFYFIFFPFLLFIWHGSTWMLDIIWNYGKWSLFECSLFSKIGVLFLFAQKFGILSKKQETKKEKFFVKNNCVLNLQTKIDAHDVFSFSGTQKWETKIKLLL